MSNKRLITDKDLEQICNFDPNSYYNSYTKKDEESYNDKLNRFEKQTGIPKIHFKRYMSKIYKNSK